MKGPMEDPAAATDAFLCQSKDHWFAIRKAKLLATHRRVHVLIVFGSFLAQIEQFGVGRRGTSNLEVSSGRASSSEHKAGARFTV